MISSHLYSRNQAASRRTVMAVGTAPPPIFCQPKKLRV